MRGQTLRTLLLGVVLCACVAPRGAVTALPPPGPSLYDSLPRTVVRLETRQDFDEHTSVSSPVGTGFLVERSGVLFLVTARHVAEAVEESRVRLSPSTPDAAAFEELVIPRAAWVFHPEASGRQQRRGGEWIQVDAVDVAVARVPWPRSTPVQPLVYCPGECHGKRSQLSSRDPQPLESVWAAGYPGYLTFELREQRPLLRFGGVALVASEPFLKDQGGRSYAEARVRALDLRSFAGDSGSPLFQRAGPEDGLELVGVVLGGDGDLDFALAEPVSRVIETLEHAARTETSAHVSVSPRTAP